jgi:primosomal protein N' (replication factor Y)
MKYVDVLVNKTKIYSYSIPEDLKLNIGSKVLVPLRNKKQEGYIIEFIEEPDFKVMPIDSSIDDRIYFNQNLVKLARWVSGHYKCFFATALKTMLP